MTDDRERTEPVADTPAPSTASLMHDIEARPLAQRAEAYLAELERLRHELERNGRGDDGTASLFDPDAGA